MYLFLGKYFDRIFLCFCFVLLYGYFVEWFFKSNWWMAFVYVAIVYVPTYFLDIAAVKRDIDYINAQLERKRENNDKI